MAELPVRLDVAPAVLRESLREELLTGRLSASLRLVPEGGTLPPGPIVSVGSVDGEGAELELDAAIGASERSRELVFELMQALVAPGRRVRVRFSEKPRRHGSVPSLAAR